MVLVTSFFNLKRDEAVLRGHENYFRNRKNVVTKIPTSPCTSHNDETKITSQHTKKNWLQNNAKWWRVISLIGKCSTTDVPQKRIPTKSSLMRSLATLLYLFVSIRSAKVQWRISIIIRSVHISFVMQQHQLKWKKKKQVSRVSGLGAGWDR